MRLKDFNTAAARRALSSQRALGAIWRSERRTRGPILARKSESFMTSASIVAQRRAAAFSRKHGLAHSPESRDDHRLLGSSALEASQEHVEGNELIVSANEGGWSGPGVGVYGLSRGSTALLIDLGKVYHHSINSDQLGKTASYPVNRRRRHPRGEIRS